MGKPMTIVLQGALHKAYRILYYRRVSRGAHDCPFRLGEVAWVQNTSFRASGLGIRA